MLPEQRRERRRALSLTQRRRRRPRTRNRSRRRLFPSSPLPIPPPPLCFLPQVLYQDPDLLARDRGEEHAVERRGRGERRSQSVVERDQRRRRRRCRRTSFLSSSSSCSSPAKRPQERGGLGGVSNPRSSGLEGVSLHLSMEKFSSGGGRERKKRVRERVFFLLSLPSLPLFTSLSPLFRRETPKGFGFFQTHNNQTHPQRCVERRLGERSDPPASLESAHERGAPRRGGRRPTGGKHSTFSTIFLGRLALALALPFVLLLPFLPPPLVVVSERKPHRTRPPVLLHEQLCLDFAPERTKLPPTLMVDGNLLLSQKVIVAQDFSVGDGDDRREDLVVVRGG